MCAPDTCFLGSKHTGTVYYVVMKYKRAEIKRKLNQFEINSLKSCLKSVEIGLTDIETNFLFLIP